MDHPFLRWMDRLYLATIWAAGTAIFFMSLIIPWGVFSRYVMGTGSQWPEPIAILLMLVICGFVAWYGTNLCIETWGQGIAELPWLPVGATYASLPIGSAVTLLFVLEKMVFGPQNHRRIVRFEELTEGA